MARKYKIVSAVSSEEMDELVTPLLNDGWQLAGGVAVTVEKYENPRKGYTETCYGFYQALWR